MLAFGTLKKLVNRWVKTEDPLRAQSIQNDLLCGQGDVESTEPTKLLMRIADYVDNNVSKKTRTWFLDDQDDVVRQVRHVQAGAPERIKNKEQRDICVRLEEFLHLYVSSERRGGRRARARARVCV